MNVAAAVNIEDLRQMARRRLPRMVFDYIDGGAEREWTLRENCRAFEDVLFRPRSAVATAFMCSPSPMGWRIVGWRRGRVSPCFPYEQEERRL